MGEPTSRSVGVRGWEAKVENRETEAGALAPGNGERKTKMRGREIEERGGRRGQCGRRAAGWAEGRPSPSLAGRVFRISGMLGMGLLP